MGRQQQMTSSISVDYKHVDGWHVFSSGDLPGLYVASKDAKEAYEDIPVAVEQLLKLNAGIECKAVPELSFDEFMASMARERPSRDRAARRSDG